MVLILKGDYLPYPLSFSGTDTATANRVAMAITGCGSGTPEILLQ